MYSLGKSSVERLLLLGFGVTLAVLLLVSVIALNKPVQSVATFVGSSIILLLGFLALLSLWVRREMRTRFAIALKTGALQDAIFNSANFSCIATDAQGVIQLFNVGAEHMLGYSAVDVIDKITPADLSDGDEVIARATALSLEMDTDIKPGFQALAFKASRGVEDIYELTYVRKDGSRFPAMVSVTALRDIGGKGIGYLLIGTDNSARKKVEAEQALLEQRLRENNLELAKAKAAAEKANLAKSEFLSSMSHELRTPLNAVLGFAQLMASDTPPPSVVQQLSLDQILRGGWYLLRLINEILDLAMVESGKVTISLESILLSEVLRDCQAMIDPQLQSRKLKLSFPDFDTPVYVYADRTRLKQIMINLLSNAIKYNSEGGEVIVHCEANESAQMRISVTDNGAGLAPEQLAQLFQPFNRLGQENGIEEGTGIGLVVTKQLIELMGGTIGVESKVGVGSIFWVELAVTEAPELLLDGILNVADFLPLQPILAPRQVLYVEDNPANLVLVERLIARRKDLKLMTAIDGHLGVQMARAYQPDVIIMDINLPGLSGFGALKLLRDDPTTTHIPVMALSANAVPRDIEKGLEAGFCRYVTKPIKVNEFMDALDVALHQATEHGLGGTRKIA